MIQTGEGSNAKTRGGLHSKRVQMLGLVEGFIRRGFKCHDLWRASFREGSNVMACRGLQRFLILRSHGHGSKNRSILIQFS